jgi:hypothetical protein
LRHPFALAATYPAQLLSYNKMLGQLGRRQYHDRTVPSIAGSSLSAGGLELFQGDRYASVAVRQLVLWNNALVTAGLRSRAEAVADGRWWGRLVENAVGAHLRTFAGLTGA